MLRGYSWFSARTTPRGAWETTWCQGLDLGLLLANHAIISWSYFSIPQREMFYVIHVLAQKKIEGEKNESI